MEESVEPIACPICRKANPDFERINARINEAKTPKDKAVFAKDLLAKVQKAMNEHPPVKDKATGTCLDILTLRQQVAELLLKVGNL